MIRSFVPLAVAILSLAVHADASPTLIDSQPDGKRVLVVDEKEVARNGQDKAILYIDGNDILTDPHGSAVLVVDDDAIRPSMAGVRLATFDGDDIRHGDIHGKVVMNYHHPDICPDSQSNRIYTVDGPELTRPQLVAVLTALKPDLFKLSEAETAAQLKAMKEAGEEADREAAKDHVVGKWEVLSASGPVEKIGKGNITFGPKAGDAYPATFDYAAGGGPSWTGVATSREIQGDRTIFAAYGTPKAIGLCIYEFAGENVTGTWYPWYFDGDAKNLGSEVLKGPASGEGEFKIVSAKAPTTGASYAGTVTITPLKIVGASDSEKPYSVTWTMGDVKVFGIGIRNGNTLFVASGAAADVSIAKFKIDNGSFSGDFFKLGSMEMGSTAAMNAE